MDWWIHCKLSGEHFYVGQDHVDSLEGQLLQRNNIMSSWSITSCVSQRFIMLPKGMMTDVFNSSLCQLQFNSNFFSIPICSPIFGIELGIEFPFNSGIDPMITTFSPIVSRLFLVAEVITSIDNEL